MTYDFKTLVDRSTMGSSKWKLMKVWNPDVAPGIVPLSVADMELKHPPELIEGLKTYLDETILGYTDPTDSYYEALEDWITRRHGWAIDRDWIVFTPGVVSAFYEAVGCFTEPGDNVLVMTPVYYPFYSAIEKNGRKMVESPLLKDENGRYSIDFDDFEAKCKDPKTKLLLLCSPHNPVSRVWRREELEKLGTLCNENGVLVLADEIHFDFVMPGHKHIIYPSMGEAFKANCILCTAPSKSFNLAGMQCSNILIPNDTLRETYKEHLGKHAGGGRLNIMAYKACELCYTRCESWFDELLALVYDSYKKITAYCAEHLPRVKVTPLEGTYLLWMDFSAYGLDPDELARIMRCEAQVFCDEGSMFGPRGDGFERMNLAAPQHVLMDAMARIKVAMAQYE